MRLFTPRRRAFAGSAASAAVQARARRTLAIRAAAFEASVTLGLQETVTNIHYHARAIAASVSRFIEDDMLRMQICDNGRTAMETALLPAAGSAA